MIGSSDSLVAIACAIRQRWLSWRRAISSFARHCCRHHSRFVGNLRVAVRGAEHAVIRSPDDGKRSPVEAY